VVEDSVGKNLGKITGKPKIVAGKIGDALEFCENTSERNVFVRIPQWASRKEIRLRIDYIEHALSSINSYLLIPGK